MMDLKTMDQHADIFERNRRRLYGIAYRMLGTRADAQDMLQEAYLRWHAADIAEVRTPQAWLTSTVTRLAIDRLRAARTEREAYHGPWLPEPLVGNEYRTPEQAAELASDLSMAFLLVLERLAPEERAAFLLHDVFDCEYREVAAALGKSEAGCRQIVHRARERVRRDRPRFQVSEAARQRLLERFQAALTTADREQLFALFAPDATWTADGGGKTTAVSKVVTGAGRIAKLLSGYARLLERKYPARVAVHPITINGEAGLVLALDGVPFWALAVETDGLRILAGYVVLNPEKLAGINLSKGDIP
jgi:RNA polymerase sigma-70 factor (ECF subfamily)